MNLSKHPYDWSIHFGLCFIAVWTGWVVWFAVLFTAILIEYEQKYQTWYYELSWRDYIVNHALGDMVADCLGILAGVYFLCN